MGLRVNILVVDDEPDMAPLFRQQFRAELKKGEFRLETAENGMAALQIMEELHQEVPLIVLSDINMPGMNGFELKASLLAKYPGLTVWLVSAYSQNANYTALAHHAGVKELIAKPINFSQLKEKIQAAIAS